MNEYPPVNIRQALQLYPNIESDLLLGHVLKQPKEFLYGNLNYILRVNELTSYKKLVARRLKGEPIAYILGYKYFYGLKFKVTKDTLIPRPETEWLVDRVRDLVKSRKLKVESVLDMGTGSGCIAVSVAHNYNPHTTTSLPKTPFGRSAKGNLWQLYASDVSPKALTIAKHNAKAHKVKIKFAQSDLFSNLKDRKFDIIIANLPYVPFTDYRKLYDDLKYEPSLALTDGTNKFNIYKQFLEQAHEHLSSNGIILLEIDPATKPYLQQWQKKYLPHSSMQFYKDAHKLWRYCVITNKKSSEHAAAT